MALMEGGPDWHDAAWAFGAALAGRASLMLGIKSDTLTWRSAFRVVLWEIPATFAMAFLGYGVATWLDLHGGPAILVIALLSRYGPDRLDPILEALVPALRRSKR
jgi:hypothetical protein